MGYSLWSCRESDMTEHMHITVLCDLNLTTSSGMLFPAKVTLQVPGGCGFGGVDGGGVLFAQYSCVPWCLSRPT